MTLNELWKLSEYQFSHRKPGGLWLVSYRLLRKIGKAHVCAKPSPSPTAEKALSAQPLLLLTSTSDVEDASHVFKKSSESRSLYNREYRFSSGHTGVCFGSHGIACPGWRARMLPHVLEAAQVLKPILETSRGRGSPKSPKSALPSSCSNHLSP